MKRHPLALILALLCAAPQAQDQPTAAASNAAAMTRMQTDAARRSAEVSARDTERARVEAERARDATAHARDRAERAQDEAERAQDEAERARDRAQRDEAPLTDAEALAIAALEGLFAAPRERALPLVQKVLAGNQSNRVKARAVFVLSQIEGDEAAKALADAARQGPEEVRIEAVRGLGIRGDESSLVLLRSLYAQSEGDARAAVVDALMIAEDVPGLFEIAKSAKTDEEARRAIDALAVSGANKELRELLKLGVHPRNLLGAYVITDSIDDMLALARGSDPDVAREAITHVGVIGGPKAIEALHEFARSDDKATREAALHGLLIAEDEQGLLALYRGTSDATRKRELLQVLTMIGGDAVYEAIDAALEGKSP